MDNSAVKFNPRISISDVARACGVSKATVSLALNPDSENSRLRDSTRQRVLRVVQELGYRPNWRARALASNRTRSLGLVYGQPFPDMSGAYESMGSVIAQTLFSFGYHLVFMPLLGQPSAWRHMVLDHRVDASLVMPPMPEGLASVLAEIEHPAILMNCDDPGTQAPRILPDDEGATDAVVDHLVALGHRRVLFYEEAKGPGHYSRAVRRNRFLGRMRQVGLGAGALTVAADADEVAAQLAEGLSAGREAPTAILAVKADRAIDLLYGLWRRGVRVPADVSIATFDDPWVLARMTPPLTTVATPMTDIGRQAAEMLVRSIESSTPLEPVRILVPARLIVRDSTAAPRAR